MPRKCLIYRTFFQLAALAENIKVKDTVKRILGIELIFQLTHQVFKICSIPELCIVPIKYLHNGSAGQ